MPTLIGLYLGERIPVPVWGMLFTVLKIVIAPVCIGVVNVQAKGYDEYIDFNGVLPHWFKNMEELNYGG